MDQFWTVTGTIAGAVFLLWSLLHDPSAEGSDGGDQLFSWLFSFAFLVGVGVLAVALVPLLGVAVVSFLAVLAVLGAIALFSKSARKAFPFLKRFARGTYRFLVNHTPKVMRPLWKALRALARWTWRFLKLLVRPSRWVHAAHRVSAAVRRTAMRAQTSARRVLKELRHPLNLLRKTAAACAMLALALVRRARRQKLPRLPGIELPTLPEREPESQAQPA